MLDVLNSIIPNVIEKWPEVVKSIYETIYLLAVVGGFSLFFGMGLGITSFVSAKGGILENRVLHFILDKAINFCRAIPFIILLIFLIPLTKIVSGTYIGTNGAIFPLIVGTAPFFARQVESALAELDHGLIEASQSMGASPLEIIFRVYIKESIPSIIRGSTITLISLIGLIAMIGTVGGGGLGNLAITYGYYSYNYDIMYVTIILLLIITTIIQALGNYLVNVTTH